MHEQTQGALMVSCCCKGRALSLEGSSITIHCIRVCVCVLAHFNSKLTTGDKCTGRCGAFHTLMSLRCKGCFCLCVILCGWVCVGMFMQSSGDVWYVGVKLCIYVCVVLHSLAQCSRPTIIRAASHTDLVLHNSYSSPLQRCGDGKHLDKWIQVSILEMETSNDANTHF